jgi:hypothetical protein
VLTLFLFVSLSEAFLTLLRASPLGMSERELRVKRVNLRVRGEPPHTLAWRALRLYKVYNRRKREKVSAYEIYKELSDAEWLDDALARLASFDSVRWDEERRAWVMEYGHIEVEVRCEEGGECEATITVNALAALFSVVEDLVHKVSILEERLKG